MDLSIGRTGCYWPTPVRCYWRLWSYASVHLGWLRPAATASDKKKAEAGRGKATSTSIASSSRLVFMFRFHIIKLNLSWANFKMPDQSSACL